MEAFDEVVPSDAASRALVIVLDSGFCAVSMFFSALRQ